MDFALATGRITETSAPQWRDALRRGHTTETVVEHLAALLPEPGSPAAAAYRQASRVLDAATDTPTASPRQANDGTAYSANPLAEQLRQTSPRVHAVATREGPPPELFTTGPLPAFTASGVDVAVLRSLPWQARWPVAAAPDRAAALHLVTQYQGDADAAVYDLSDFPQNRDYASRVRAWAIGPADAPDRPGGPDTYRALFGES